MKIKLKIVYPLIAVSLLNGIRILLVILFLPLIFLAIFGLPPFPKTSKKRFMDYLGHSLRTFVFIIIPLLIIAALIEGTLIHIMQ